MKLDSLINLQVNSQKFNILSAYDAQSAINSMKVCKFFYEFAFKEANLKKIEEAKIGYEFCKRKALEFKANILELPEELNYLEKQN